MAERLDPQHNQVYEAEDAAFAAERKAGEQSLAELQAWSDQIVSANWFQARWQLLQVAVLDGRGSRHARAHLRGLQMPKRCRYPYYVVHELTHWVDRTGGEDHGAVFCGLYLHFVRRVYGWHRAEVLAKEFRKRGVVWDRWVRRYGQLVHG